MVEEVEKGEEEGEEEGEVDVAAGGFGSGERESVE